MSKIEVHQDWMVDGVVVQASTYACDTGCEFWRVFLDGSEVTNLGDFSRSRATRNAVLLASQLGRPVNEVRVFDFGQPGWDDNRLYGSSINIPLRPAP